jgi:phosphoribosylaminoimidazole (AIR) synthetase
MVVVVAAEAADQASALLTASGETVFRMGGLEAGSGEAQVRIDRLAATWPR